MKKTLTTIGAIATMGIILVCAYWLGTTQAETEVQTITETVEVTPDDYIPLDECIPLEDIGCYFIDGYGYPCFELKDVATQYNMDDTRSYADIMDGLTDETEDFRENYVDMRNVVGFETTEYGLQLYMEDGSGYYWEPESNIINESVDIAEDHIVDMLSIVDYSVGDDGLQLYFADGSGYYLER